MTTATRYIEAARATQFIETMLPAANPMRAAWEALDTTQQEAALDEATAMIDAPRYIGVIEDADEDGDPETHQTLAWPRVWEAGTRCAGELIEPDPDPHESDPVPTAPLRVKKACAIQAAAIAYRDSGSDPTAHIEEAVSRGVTSQSGGGQAESYDLHAAQDAISRLCAKARTLLVAYRRTTARVL